MKTYLESEINNKDNQNQSGLSLLRALATFSVIIIHVSASIVIKYGVVSFFYWNIGNFFDGLCRYSVPMFFVVSGALLLNKDYSTSEFFKKRFLKILPPFVFWSIVYSVFKTYFLGNKSFNLLTFLDKLIRDLFYGSEYHLWFIYVLLGIYLITPIIRKWIKNVSQNEILYFLIIWVITMIYRVPGLNIYFPKIELMYFSGYLGYFVLGYYLAIVKVKSRLIPLLFLIFGCLITILGTYYFTLMNNEFFDYFYGYLTINTLMVTSGLFLLLRNLSVTNIKLKNFLIKLNQCCLGIYLIHALVLRLFDLMGYNLNISNPILSIPTVSLSCFIICFFIVYFIRKLKYGKLIVG